VIASVVLGLGLAVSGASAAPRATQDDRTLVIGSGFFDYIDPALLLDPSSQPAISSALAQWAVADATCAMLLRYPVGAPTKQDYRLVPEVAADYPNVSPDGKTYTFTIRKGFRFHTGALVTAANYARAIDRARSPLLGSPALKYLQEVGAVSATGNRLVIRLTKRVPDFPARMTMPYLCPVPQELPIAPEGVAAPPPGSGPYYVAEFVPGKQVVLKRNSYYPRPRAQHFDQIVVRVGDEASAWSREVEAGTGDVDFNVPVPRLAELGARYAVNKTQLFAIPSANVYYLYMNTARPLFRRNVKLRQAVNFAIDRRQMLSGLGALWAGSVTDDYLAPGLSGYVDAHLYPLRHPELKEAKALALGHTRSGKAVLYTCNLAPYTGCLENAQTVRDNLEAIGIDVRIDTFPLATFETKTGTRGEPFDLTFDRLVVPWVDPYQYVNLLLDGRRIGPTENTNRSYFNSAHYNRLMDEAGRLSGRARWVAYGKLAVDLAKNAAPMAAVFVRYTRFFVSSRIGCVRASAHGFDLASLCLR